MYGFVLCQTTVFHHHKYNFKKLHWDTLHLFQISKSSTLLQLEFEIGVINDKLKHKICNENCVNYVLVNIIPADDLSKFFVSPGHLQV